MMSKRSIIAALAGVNLFLLASLVLSSYSPNAAYGQRMGASSNFVSVTCQVDNGYDVLYLLDLGQRKLHCFAPNRNKIGDVAYCQFRDLKLDFGR